MPENIVIEKLREALVSLITAGMVGTDNIYNERNSAEKAAPCVICAASNATEEPLSSGNFWIDAEVIVKSLAAVEADAVDPKTSADTLSATVFALLEVDDLESQLSAQLLNFTVIGLGAEKSFEESQDGDCWVQTWKRRMYCAGTDL